MSAESPRRSRVGGPLVVPPQPPCDRSLMDTVSGFISDVTLASSPGLDPKDAVQWARFEGADIAERADCEDGDTLPLLLVVGYGAGVQVWAVQPGGEAQEVLAWRQGAVRVLRLLPTPSRNDHYASKRPLVVLCDTAGPGAPYCSLSFISLTIGDQVKSIKFKNPILDVVANKRSIVVSFAERLAVFDACTLEDRLTVTTCYPCPCPLGGASPTNPLTLGDRWLAYAERRLSPTKRSSGGCEGEGVASYTATVLHAAKSLGKGLRGLGESVASSLGGARSGGLSQSPSPPNSEQLQPGVVTIIDLESWKINDEGSADAMEDSSITAINNSVIAHFIAHSESIVALKFDASGMILVTADRRGHDFHVFRIHPHPSGPSQASVHHLYILHRGDTTAKVQDISISLDCRWTAVSTLRGTTHVFPITPYGGAVGVRTHASPHVVNRLSRFHRSAGLAADGRSNSPVGENLVNSAWYPNPRLPPFPVPCSIPPLAQLRPAPANGAAPTIPTHTITRNSAGRQRLSSLSEEGQLPLAVCSRWGAAGRGGAAVARARGLPSPPASQALYVMSAHGHLVQYYIHPKHASGIPKEKVCDDTSIELEVEAKAQWPLLRPTTSHDIMAPLPPNNILIKPINAMKNSSDKGVLDAEDRWLSQVEIMTHAGPHRRLWMGPQFVFKTYNATSGTSLSLLDSDAVEVGTGPAVARSNPVNMPGARPIVPVLIESGSASSLEHSPRLSDAYRKGINRECVTGGREDSDGGHREGEVRLKEDLAEAMRDTDQGCEWTGGDWSRGEDSRAPHVHRIVNPLGTVVSGASSDSPSPPSHRDEDYILSNEDEALFRPVVRAPRSLPAPQAPPSRPLSSRTLLPAQHLPPPPAHTPAPSAAPLADRVVIPVRLTQESFGSTKQLTDAENDSTVNVQTKSEVIVKQCADGRRNPVEAKAVSMELKTISVEVNRGKENLKASPPKETRKKASNKKVKDNKKLSNKRGSVESTGQESPDSLQSSVENTKINCEDFDNSEKSPLISCIEEISKAVDKIEICNSELISNIEVIHISDWERGKFTKSPSPVFSTASITNTDQLFMDCSNTRNTDKEEEEEEVYNVESIDSENVTGLADDVSEDYVVPTKEVTDTSKFKSENTGRAAEESSWELLTDERPKDDFVNVEENKIEQILTNDEILEATSNDSKYKSKKSKRGKSRLAINTKLDIAKIVPDIDDVLQESCVDSVLTEEVVPEVPKVSWSTIASSSNKKEVESSSDELFKNKISSIYKKGNLVVAVCDTPQTDLCFIDEHHSVFQEPPPLEPLDMDEERFELDDQKLQEMKDSFLDFQSATNEDDSPRESKSDCNNYTLVASQSFEVEQEDLSSSSFSSASRASLDPPSSPTPSCSGDNILHFPGDSSGSV